MPIFPWTDPNAIIKSGTVVFGPSLYTPLPNHGAEIMVKIYRGINANNTPSGAMVTETDIVMVTETDSIMITES